ncbi:MAG: hypothetical protein JSS07_10965 [Proteobacteria bacterium]|nr:hypothetical protein [Pseudomonadota bacterium]
MRQLNTTEVQQISGAGLISAIVALPVAVAVGAGGAGMGAASGFVGAFLQGKGYFEILKTGFRQGLIGTQLGTLLETSAYNW